MDKTKMSLKISLKNSVNSKALALSHYLSAEIWINVIILVLHRLFHSLQLVLPIQSFLFIHVRYCLGWQWGCFLSINFNFKVISSG